MRGSRDKRYEHDHKRHTKNTIRDIDKHKNTLTTQNKQTEQAETGKQWKIERPLGDLIFRNWVSGTQERTFPLITLIHGWTRMGRLCTASI